MAALRPLQSIWKICPDSCVYGVMSSSVRNNHNKTEFAFSRNRKPFFRSIPHPKEKREPTSRVQVPQNFMKIYPEFLPDPQITRRNKLSEKLERKDMISRRKLLDIPEFYVGTIMAVTISDQNATNKMNRFLGICVDRGSSGLRAWFVLRNIIDNIGIEIRYEQYCPMLLNIEVLRLEKRLDEKLYYLRDCDPIHSTVPLDMQAELIAEGSAVPVNPIKVKLLPEPWRQKYDLVDYKGVDLPDDFDPKKLRESLAKRTPYYEKFDLMTEYRATIPEEEQEDIFRDISTHYPALKAAERKFRRRKISNE